MDIRKKLSDLYDGVIMPILLNIVLEHYQEDLADGSFVEEERDYVTAKEALDLELSAENKKLLSEIEKLYEAKLSYATRYGFGCGLTYGFAQCLAPLSYEEYSFNEIVGKGLFEVPGMHRHPKYKEASDKCLVSLTYLEETLPTELNEHMISVACAWDQRVYSSARDAFYLGYQAAYSFMDDQYPTQSIRNIGKILELEFELGYTDAYYRRKKESKKVG